MGLRIWLPFNNDTLNYGISDVSKLSHNGTLSSSGKLGKCIACDSTNYYSANYTIDETRNFTLSFWLKMPNNASTNTSWFNALVFSGKINGTTSNLTINWSDYQSLKIYDSGGEIQLAWLTKTQLPYDTWNLITITHTYTTTTNSVISIYVNGSLYGAYTANNTTLAVVSGTLKLGPNFTTANGPIYFNDVRIYDHCLSPKEIMELKKCMVCHIPLNDGYIEPTTNYAPSTGVPYKSYTTTAWDTSLHPNALSVGSWSTGINTGVTDVAKGYHAYWTLIDNIPTLVFQDLNSTIGQLHRWLGTAVSINNFGSNKTYTVSFDARSDVEGKYISTGVYYSKSGSRSFHDGQKQVYTSTSWKRYSLTFTLSSTPDGTYSSLYIYGNYGPEGTSYVRNVQFEYNDHATPYTSSTREETIVTDVTGYGNNGTVAAASAPDCVNGDSPRYNAYCRFDGDTQGIKVPLYKCIGGLSTYTINLWFYKTEFGSKNWESLLAGSGFEIESKRSNTNSPMLVAYSWGQNNEGGQVYDLNKWNMVTVVNTSSDSKWYLNGKLYATLKSKAVPTNDNIYIGAYNSPTGQNFKGNISDLRVYSSSLSAEDIMELYNTPFSVTNNGQILIQGEVSEA